MQIFVAQCFLLNVEMSLIWFATFKKVPCFGITICYFNEYYTTTNPVQSCDWQPNPRQFQRSPWKLPRFHDDVIKWKHFPRNWPSVRGIHRSPVNSPHKGQWRGALMFSLICVWINGWVNSREAGDLRRYHAHYDVTVMIMWWSQCLSR